MACSGALRFAGEPITGGTMQPDALRLSLDTLIAASPLLGHLLEDRPRIRDGPPPVRAEPAGARGRLRDRVEPEPPPQPSPARETAVCRGAQAWLRVPGRSPYAELASTGRAARSDPDRPAGRGAGLHQGVP